MSWTIEDSEEIYGIPYWGAGMFHINPAGNLVATPLAPKQCGVDLHEFTLELEERGIHLPVLLRMPQLTERRLDQMWEVFQAAIEEHDYTGTYRGVYPVKVNQQRQLVEEILRVGRKHHVGLEAGSKAELLIAMALMEDPEGRIVCNGYKDRRYIETALLAQKLGCETTLVVEKLSELNLILKIGEEVGVRPRLGVRSRLSNPGDGHWRSSAGDRAKFGLSALDIVSLVEQLRASDRLDCLKMLHFHIGSQVSSIHTFKRALREASRLYIELVHLGAPMGTIDIGGGLAVDYDGSRTNFESSRNYTDSEYASDVVDQVGAACSAAGVAHPDIVTESGRATVAHCSVLLFNVLGVETHPVNGPPKQPHKDAAALLHELWDVYEDIATRGYQETWHDAQDVRTRSRHAFDLGALSLSELAEIDRLFWQVCGEVQRIVAKQTYVPDELQDLDATLADTYYGNFSVFQSVPDAWAIGQVFPCVPVHRLNEEPSRRAVIADLTCDSDGTLSQFGHRGGIKNVLELHPLRDGEPYVLAVALVGAYQEILGDLHNLFGDTNAVHLSVNDEGQIRFDLVIEGDSVESVTSYVQYERKELVHRIRQAVEKAIRLGNVDRKEAARLVAFYREGLDSYTYLGN